MNTYYSSFVTNNGTHNAKPYENSNKAKAYAEIAKIARGHLGPTDSARVYVWRIENDRRVDIYAAVITSTTTLYKQTEF